MGKDPTNVQERNDSSRIDAYIASMPEEHRDILQKVRSVIWNAAPDAIEKIAWQMPSFTFSDPRFQGKYIIHFASFKNHLGIYPGDKGVLAFKDRLDRDGYRYTKGAIQFPYKKPIPYDFIEEITRWKAKTLRTQYG